MKTKNLISLSQGQTQQQKQNKKVIISSYNISAHHQRVNTRRLTLPTSHAYRIFIGAFFKINFLLNETSAIAFS
jgi:hypothetical protein